MDGAHVADRAELDQGARIGRLQRPGGQQGGSAAPGAGSGTVHSSRSRSLMRRSRSAMPIGFASTSSWNCCSAACALQLGGVGRDDDDHQALEPALPQPFRNLPAVRAGHRDVHQKQVGLALGRDPQALVAVGRGEHDKAERRQQVLQQAAMDRVVVGDQHRQPPPGVAATRGSRSAPGAAAAAPRTGADAPRSGCRRRVCW